MNRPTKNQTKAIVYSCCWQSVSVRMRVGNGCILRSVGECGVSVGSSSGGSGVMEATLQSAKYCCQQLAICTLTFLIDYSINPSKRINEIPERPL